MIDGVTLTDSITNLFQQGKIANVSVIAGFVNDEGANTAPRTTTPNATNSGLYNLTTDQINSALAYYPVNTTFGYDSPDNFFLTPFKSYIMSLSPFGEAGISGSERLVGRSVSDKLGGNRVWTFRFNAPSTFSF